MEEAILSAFYRVFFPQVHFHRRMRRRAFILALRVRTLARELVTPRSHLLNAVRLLVDGWAFPAILEISPAKLSCLYTQIVRGLILLR